MRHEQTGQCTVLSFSRDPEPGQHTQGLAGAWHGYSTWGWGVTLCWASWLPLGKTILLAKEVKVGVRLPGPMDANCVPLSIIPALPAIGKGQSQMVVC